MPKLLRHLLSGPQRLRKLREGFFRIHYLTSIAGVNLGLVALIVYPFPDTHQSLWLPLTAAPYYALYARDLWLSGYRQRADLLRVYALNLLLLPVNLGGVLRSLHQGLRGHKIAFQRTPKVAGRTRVASRHLLAAWALAGLGLATSVIDALAGRWLHVSFSLINAGLFLYAIHAFIGWRASWQDIRHGWARHAAQQPAPGTAADAAAVPEAQAALAGRQP